MNHAELRQEIAGRIDLLLGGSMQLSKQPRPYQRETLLLLQQWLRASTQGDRAHIVYATGLGKTVLFTLLIAACYGIRILVVVPTKVLLEQTAREIVAVTGGVIGEISSLPNVRNDANEIVAIKTLVDVDIVVITDESLVSKKDQVIKTFNPQLIVYDECHWAYKHPAMSVLKAMPEAIVIGFTATPDYLTNVAMSSYVPVELDTGSILYGSPSRFATTHFGTKLDDRSVQWGIMEGYLAPMDWSELSLYQTSLERVSLVEGPGGLDYKVDELNQAISETWEQTCQAVTQLYQKGPYDLASRHVFSICPSVLMAEELAEAVRSIGITAACVTGKTPNKQRRDILKAFKRGEIQFISSVMVLREGWDSPNADVCLMLRPTRSRLLYMQTIGRVLRIAANDAFKKALIIDAHFQDERFGPFSAPMIFGQPGQRIRIGGSLIGDHQDMERHPDAAFVTVPDAPAIEREAQGNEQGILVHNEIEYWLLETFSSQYHIPVSILKKRSVSGRIRRIIGRTYARKRSTFYRIEDLEEFFFFRGSGAKIIEGGFGIIHAHADEWWTLRSFMRRYAISDEEEISQRIVSAEIRCILRPNDNGVLCHFYPIAALQGLFHDLISAVA